MKSDKVYVTHILESINSIDEYTDKMRRTDFLDSSLVQDAVIRNLQVIGEAAKKISTETKEISSDIPWRKMAGMRDKLIHDYMGVDLWAVWLVVEKELPPLNIKLKEILNKLD